TPTSEAVAELGNGSNVTTPDTVLLRCGQRRTTSRTLPRQCGKRSRGSATETPPAQLQVAWLLQQVLQSRMGGLLHERRLRLPRDDGRRSKRAKVVSCDGGGRDPRLFTRMASDVGHFRRGCVPGGRGPNLML